MLCNDFKRGRYCNGVVVFLDRIVDLAQKLFGPIWLADEATVVRYLGFGWLYLARGDYKQHVRPARVYLAGKFQSVAASFDHEE